MTYTCNGMSFSLKKKQILIPVTEWMNSEDIILHKIYQLQKEILYESTDIRYLEKRQTIEWWLPEVSQREMGCYCLMDIEFQFGKMKKLWKWIGDDGCTTI